ncbi:MAG: hypothetical protein HY701_04375 [Gemmatimonadetes bacterium]|nr:hypothetical protein [Gemmatimonadota bacterium]
MNVIGLALDFVGVLVLAAMEIGVQRSEGYLSLHHSFVLGWVEERFGSDAADRVSSWGRIVGWGLLAAGFLLQLLASRTGGNA